MAGRKPIGKTAMTPAERQSRRRKKLAKAESAETRRIKQAKARAKNREEYMPMPPGIHFWESRRVRMEDGSVGEIRMPIEKPLATIKVSDLENEDLMSLTRSFLLEMHRRGLDPSDMPASILESRKLLAD